MTKPKTSTKKATFKNSFASKRVAPTPAPEPPAVAPKKSKAAKVAPSHPEAPTARKGGKKATVLELLRRPEGASLKELMIATGWQAHTVRGYISGILGKNMALAVESFRDKDNVRTYRLPA